MPIKEYKTHYAKTRHCKYLGRDVTVEQLKIGELIIVGCDYNRFGECYINFDYNNGRDIRFFKPEICSLGLGKLIEKVEEKNDR